MIIGGSKRAVIDNIQKYANAGLLNHKVEINDASLNQNQRINLIHDYLQLIKMPKYHVNNLIARGLADVLTELLNTKTTFSGLEKIKNITGGAIITSNHFSPLENTVVRKTLWQIKHRRLFIVSEDTNLLTNGFIGFLLKYYDTIPVSPDVEYIGKVFPKMIKGVLNDNNFILIYPEQEMWFNYRKPRPPKRGAYYYAAKFHVPIISCFVEIIDLQEPDNYEFNKVKFKMHILDPIYLDPNKSVRENSIEMMQRDYQQKKKAYEQIYDEKLTYNFNIKDIAGWRAGTNKNN
ncbi:lysophospholipid acyltransferase family protein [Loigolactobacillus binensis]|uniref:Lysophospholipid acyltransferase family protein n=1 Tax=Loigolactobacillus binensis TaxID=2559922 RepID=A0ABW3EF41_9LACO|nr:lysophospholipid acyltransferase family protein [Loigolactobacillus binensis]